MPSTSYIDIVLSTRLINPNLNLSLMEIAIDFAASNRMLSAGRSNPVCIEKINA
jgi:hypothetical protein